MEKVLKLGLLCCNPKPEARPAMRQVLQIIEGEAFVSTLEAYERSGGNTSSTPDAGQSLASSSNGSGGTVV